MEGTHSHVPPIGVFCPPFPRNWECACRSSELGPTRAPRVCTCRAFASAARDLLFAGGCGEGCGPPSSAFRQGPQGVHERFPPLTSSVFLPARRCAAKTSVSQRAKRDPRRRSSIPSLSRNGMILKHQACSSTATAARLSSPARRAQVSAPPLSPCHPLFDHRSPDDRGRYDDPLALTRLF